MLFNKILKVINPTKLPTKERFDDPILNETYKNLTEADIAIVIRTHRIKELVAERDERLKYRSTNPTSFDDWINDNPETQGTYEGWADANPEAYNPTSDN